MNQAEVTYDEFEESPASKPIFSTPTFADGTYLYQHNNENQCYSFSLETVFPESFSISIKMINIHQGHVVIGFSDKPIENLYQSYIGGASITGQFGFASNGVIGRNGTWFWPTDILKYDTGDTITFIGESGEITCLVNDNGKSDYVYKMDTSDLYLGFTFYYKGDTIEIV